ncbi:MAG: VPDSG-CTERM sorting domain-containing protein [Verrucomicrobia bacterium]|nr:VPDSG-CTERM sorting domain-containing protein [Verrucomicrobiota bacterium]
MKYSLKSLVLVVALAGLVSSAKADKLTLSQNHSYSVGIGGAYVAKVIDGPISNADYSGAAKIGTNSFLTFCIEYNEYFTSGSTLNYVLNNGSVNGGVSGQTAKNYDGISNGTAYLYSLFAQGNLAGVAGFAYNTSSHGYGYLQNAIWNLEGEIKSSNSLSNWVKSNVANWNADSNGSYGVQALNLTNVKGGGKAQDQLYYHNVPEQGLTVALLGLALVGIAGFRRKFSSAK